MSQVRRRLAHKTSALGLMGALVVSVCSVFALSAPAQAAADKTMDVTYDCTGGFFAATGIKVTVTAPDTVEPSGTASVKWTMPTSFTATKNLVAQTAISIEGTLTVAGGGTPASLKGTHTGTVSAAGTTYTPTSNTMTATVTAPSSGGPVTLSPGTADTTQSFKITATPPNGGTAETTNCTYQSATPTTSLSIAVQTGGGNGTGDDIIAYNCDLGNSATDADYPLDVDIKVAMTTPTSASANADASITWTGTIQTGSTLPVPTGFPTTSPKLYATIKASGAGTPATATGEATLTSVSVGSNITTLPTVTIKVKPTTTGTVTLTPGDLAFGTSSTSPAIKCTAPTSNLKTWTFTVGNGTSTPTPTPTPTPTTTTPRPTTTHTSTVTVTPTESTTRKSQTPKAGADTGAGGMAGPDGRLFVLVGTGLIGAAAVGGLVMRRRSIKD